jgi:hypothetical protein
MSLSRTVHDKLSVMDKTASYNIRSAAAPTTKSADPTSAGTIANTAAIICALFVAVFSATASSHVVRNTIVQAGLSRPA